MTRGLVPSLFEQTKNLKNIGARLSGEPEILHDIEDYFREVEPYPVARRQIQTILESVPAVFPENWKSPDGYNQLTSEQQMAYMKIATGAVVPCTGPIIQRVIELGVEYRTKHSPIKS